MSDSMRSDRPTAEQRFAQILYDELPWDRFPLGSRDLIHRDVARILARMKAEGVVFADGGSDAPLSDRLRALAADWRVRANVQLTERAGLRKSQKVVRAQKLRWAMIYNECAAGLESALRASLSSEAAPPVDDLTQDESAARQRVEAMLVGADDNEPIVLEWHSRKHAHGCQITCGQLWRMLTRAGRAALDPLKAAIVAVVEHAEESGECRECGAEVCRGSPHEIDPPCRIGTLKFVALHAWGEPV